MKLREYSANLDNVNLTKEFILSNFSQIDVVSFYLGIPSQMIDSCIRRKTKIRSPMRNDKNPSLGFYFKRNNKLVIKDFAGYFCGDIFDLVAHLIYVNSNDKEGFKEVLKDIWYNMANQVLGTDFNRIKHNVTSSKNHIPKMIYESRELNKYDYEYWGKYQINPESLDVFLDKNNVIPVSLVAYKGKVIYNYQTEEEKDISYAYVLGKINDTIVVELYRPNATKYHKFKTNYSAIKGLLFFKHTKYLLITKSYKDLILIKEYLEIANIKDVTVIALPSETYNLSKKEFDILSNNFKRVFSFLDYDLTGIKQMNNLKRKFNVIPLFIKSYKENKKIKDFADLAKHYNYKSIINLINKLYKNVERNT